MYNILLVDDDATIGFIYSHYTVWEKCGFNIKAIVSDGKEALRQLETTLFDLIITDIKMPVINGLELLTLIRERQYQLPVILASSYKDFEYAQQGLRLGAIDYLVKPIYESTLEPLLTKIKNILDYQSLLMPKSHITSSKTQETLSLYMSTEDIKELIEFFITLNPQLNYQLRLYYHKAVTLFGLHSTNMILFLEHIINHLWNNLYERFSWLKDIEPTVLKPSLTLSSPFELETRFYETILSMQQMIIKYRLSHKSSVVHLACSYLAENILASPSMQDVADRLNLNKDYFGKLFKQQTGIYFNDYAQKLKIEYAKTLLLTSNYKVYEISDLLGYSSVDYFLKLFKTYTGMSPTHYKKHL